MYEKARRGESIELSPRLISISQFDVERSLDDRLCNCLLAFDDTTFCMNFYFVISPILPAKF